MHVWVQIAQFSFVLPPAEQMDKLGRWMTAAMVFIDTLGNYKMKPEQKVRLLSHPLPRISIQPSLRTEQHWSARAWLRLSGFLTADAALGCLLRAYRALHQWNMAGYQANIHSAKLQIMLIPGLLLIGAEHLAHEHGSSHGDRFRFLHRVSCETALVQL